MANERDRIPKEGDRVRTPNVKDGFVVVSVRENPNVVDLDLLNGQLRIKNIPWTMLTYLDGELDGGVPEGFTQAVTDERGANLIELSMPLLSSQIR